MSKQQCAVIDSKGNHCPNIPTHTFEVSASAFDKNSNYKGKIYLYDTKPFTIEEKSLKYRI